MCPSEDSPKRKALRLPGYDYAEPGGYFVTVCTQGKKCAFGQIESGKMHLNPAGHIVQQVWLGLPQRFPSRSLDSFVVMPNHMHGILVLVGAGLAPPADVVARTPGNVAIDHSQKSSFIPGISVRATATGGASPAPTGGSFVLGDVLRAFKSISTIEVNRLLRQRGVHLWQRNYYEHIVRNGDDMDNIRRYILDNPLQWDLDPENPVPPANL
jgi:putative transposase